MTLEKKVTYYPMSLSRRLLLTGSLEDFSEYLDGENVLDEGRHAPEEFNTQLVKTLFDINLTFKKVNMQWRLAF
jgi:hypothetical protein